jgi:uncharacterized glyoxalase superfamily protein PhnB
MPLSFQGICPLLQVFDMPTSLAFYRDVLGFGIEETSPPASEVTGDKYGWVWLRADRTELMLNTAYDPHVERPAVPDPARVAAHEDTMLFIGCADVDAAFDDLRQKGVDAHPPTVTAYGMKQLTIKDPDGFTLCFQGTAEAPNVLIQMPGYLQPLS